MAKETFIDKIALIYIKNKRILMALSKGKDTYYIPGGKRETSESDEETLVREIKEELNVDIDVITVRHYGTFTAQAHGKSVGIMVRMICYTANFNGSIKPSNEIKSIDWYDYNKRDIVGPVDKMIFDDLKKKRLL